MFMDWKNQYSENEYTTQSNLRFNAIPIKLPMVFFTKLLLLLSHFSHVQLCATPETAAHQAPPSLGFSRQEHRNGFSSA